MRVEAENGATAGKTDLAKRAKAANLDAIHDTVHEMARDEARHGKEIFWLIFKTHKISISEDRWLFNCLSFFAAANHLFSMPVRRENY